MIAFTSYLSPSQPSRRWQWVVVVALVVALVGGGAFFLWRRDRGSAETMEGMVAGETDEALPEVGVESVTDLQQSGRIEKLATVEPLQHAPLVARVGGRVTSVVVSLGDTVRAGQLLVAVDTGDVANPLAVQEQAARSSLAAFDSVERGALASADSAVRTAELALEAAETGKGLAADTVAKQREQADTAVLSAQFALEDARETGDDVLVRTADLALKAARIAQDQATLARQGTAQQSSDALKQAQQAVLSAQVARSKLGADLASQRIAFENQISAAREQLALAQIVSPLSGQVTRLDVQEGDFVRPGQDLGEVNAFGGALVRLDTTTGVRRNLFVGDTLPIQSSVGELTGTVLALADAPNQETLWQVDIGITQTPGVIHPGEQVRVQLPIGPQRVAGAMTSGDDSEATSYQRFLPLDAVVVRQDGSFVFTVDAEGIVHEHRVTVRGFVDDFVDGEVALPADAQIITSGNRMLRDGDTVSVQ